VLSANLADQAQAPPSPWYRLVGRRQWQTLALSGLGWLFDGFETYAIIITVGVALRQLLPRAELHNLPLYAGAVIAVTLLGWGVGGFVGGVAADYLGRKRTMIWAVVAYSLLTGLTAVSWSWWSLALLRFLTGLAIGTEWATGTAMIAEVWPQRARAKAAGIMQAGFGVGFFIAAGVWYLLVGLGPSAWRYIFLVGILPSLLAAFIQTHLRESERWEEAHRTRRAVRARLARGERLDEAERRFERFTLAALWAEPEARRVVLLGSVMSLATGLGFWGMSTWVPAYIGAVAGQHHLQAALWASYAGLAFTGGSIVGYAAMGFAADLIGRRGATAAYMLLGLILTPLLFLGVHDLGLLLFVAAVNGCFTSGQYSWMPVWLPELFPTRMRGTGVSVVFNLARFVVWLGPLLSGAIITALGGYGIAGSVFALVYVAGLLAIAFTPETRGKPLPT
jgi:MFS family permease